MGWCNLLWKRNWIYVWSYDPGAADFIQILEKQGLKKGSYITGMALPLTYWTYQAQEIPNLEVKPLRTKSDFAWFGEVVLPTFGLKDEAGDLFLQINEKCGTERVFRHYVGLVDG